MIELHKLSITELGALICEALKKEAGNKFKRMRLRGETRGKELEGDNSGGTK
jgi:hypothetical protein